MRLNTNLVGDVGLVMLFLLDLFSRSSHLEVSEYWSIETSASRTEPESLNADFGLMAHL